MTPDEMVVVAKEAAASLGASWDERLGRLLRVGLLDPKNLLPSKARKKWPEDGNTNAIQTYIAAYTRDFYAALNRPTAWPSGSTVPDPAVGEVLAAFKGVPRTALTQHEGVHRLSMQAESLVGGLLEAYVATCLEGQGWLWARGNTLRAVDFVKDDPSRTRLLQVKNRDNSENSSSSAIRTGTAIEKWYRIASRSMQTYWQNLPDNNGTLSEEGFYRFISEAARQMPMAAPQGQLL